MGYPKNMKLIHGIVIMDDEGRVIVKNYYSDEFKTKSAQDAFEKRLFDKFHNGASKVEVSLGLLDKYIILSRAGADITIFFLIPDNQNELIGVEALDGFYEALNICFKDKVDRAELLKHIPYVYLVMDELCDNGVLCETDAGIINKRVEMKDN
ncbi:hypothetical protein WA158_007660 [Blastocystis sp. Blastoise]